MMIEIFFRIIEVWKILEYLKVLTNSKCSFKIQVTNPLKQNMVRDMKKERGKTHLSLLF